MQHIIRRPYNIVITLYGAMHTKHISNQVTGNEMADKVEQDKLPCSAHNTSLHCCKG